MEKLYECIQKIMTRRSLTGTQTVTRELKLAQYEQMKTIR